MGILKKIFIAHILSLDITGDGHRISEKKCVRVTVKYHNVVHVHACV